MFGKSHDVDDVDDVDDDNVWGVVWNDFKNDVTTKARNKVNNDA